MWKQTSPTIKDVEYPIAADHNGAVAKAYGVYQEHNGMAVRGRFIISPDGEVKAVEMLTPPVGRNVDELLRQIKALQAVEANPGMAAPAEWKPGDKMIGTRKEFIGAY